MFNISSFSNITTQPLLTKTQGQSDSIAHKISLVFLQLEFSIFLSMIHAYKLMKLHIYYTKTMEESLSSSSHTKLPQCSPLAWLTQYLMDLSFKKEKNPTSNSKIACINPNQALFTIIHLLHQQISPSAHYKTWSPSSLWDSVLQWYLMIETHVISATLSPLPKLSPHCASLTFSTQPQDSVLSTNQLQWTGLHAKQQASGPIFLKHPYLSLPLNVISTSNCYWPLFH